jgi:hypothetical protein
VRKTLAIVGAFIGLAFILWSIWLVGIVCEFEYPYELTLIAVTNSKSASDVPVSKIIKSDGSNWGRGPHWHTCSYCCDFCGTNRNLISVHIQAPDKSTMYYFAYCRRTHILVPMTDHTAAHFPLLMPPGDKLQPVGILDGSGQTISLGYGEMKLPAKWYRSGFRAFN